MQDLHGGNLFAHRVKLDFSANINPLGLPEGIREAVTAAAGFWAHYPDPDCTALTQALAASEQVPPERIVCGSGADDLLFRIAAAYRPETALLAVPCFSEYRRALEAAGCRVQTHLLRPENGFALDDTILPAIREGLGMLVLCTPNNPTGRLIDRALLGRIAERCRACGTVFLLDACFLPLTEAFAQPLPETAVVVRAFTKSHAIPGLRLGYAVCPDAASAQRIRGQGPYWSVSAPAQAAGLAALRETDYLARARRLIADERAFLTREMQALGLRVYPSDANFLLFQADPALGGQLLAAQILVRSCANFEGLDGSFYRIAVRPHDENTALLAALRR